MTTSRIHVHANIRPNMSDDLIRADVRTLFDLDPDFIGINEACTITRDEIWDLAEARGYGVYVPRGAADQLVLVWKKSTYRVLLRKTKRAGVGRASVSPHRYVARVRLVDVELSLRVVAIVSHMISSGWTGVKHLDAWRRAHWFAHQVVLRRILMVAYRANAAVYWGLDGNRPPRTFKNPRRPFPRLRPAGARTAAVADTGPTHGRERFDYMGVASRDHKITTRARTIPLHSDHHAIATTYTWHSTGKKA